MPAHDPLGGQVPAHRPLGGQCGHLSNWVVFTSHCACMHQIFFWWFLRHVGTFLDYLGGVDTPGDRVPVLNTGPSWANTWGVGRSISQLLLGPHAPNIFSQNLRHIGTFLDYLGGVDTPMGRVPVPKTLPHWANTWGGGGQYLSFY